MKNILILGSEGQLGNELQIAFNSSASSYVLFCPPFSELDITDKKSLSHYFDANAIDIVINCAAYTAVDKAEEHSALNDTINNSAVKDLANISAAQQTFLFHISTDFVFDGKKNTPYIESDATNPLQEYGKAKLQGEAWVKHGIVIRTSWLYSVFGNNFVKTMMHLAKERDSLNVIDNQIGTPTYAADLANCIYTIINDESYHQSSGVYHFSNEGVASWYDFACSIMEYADLDCHVKPIPASSYPTPAKRPSYSVLNKHKIKETFNVRIPYWRTSLKKCINLLNEK